MNSLSQRSALSFSSNISPRWTSWAHICFPSVSIEKCIKLETLDLTWQPFRTSSSSAGLTLLSLGGHGPALVMTSCGDEVRAEKLFTNFFVKPMYYSSIKSPLELQLQLAATWWKECRYFYCSKVMEMPYPFLSIGTKHFLVSTSPIINLTISDLSWTSLSPAATSGSSWQSGWSFPTLWSWVQVW